MKRPSSAQPGLRHAMKAGLAALVLAAGATWLLAGDTSSTRDGTKTLRLAQAAPAAAPAASNDATFDAKQKSAIEGIIREYLLANPEVLGEMNKAFETKTLKTAINDASIPVIGNPKGDVPVVEFFDYNCGYCKVAYRGIAELIEEDKNVRVILMELPILSKGSVEASRLALAAGLQGQYWPVHQALITLRGEVNEQTALRAIEKLQPALDIARLKKDAEGEAVTEHLVRIQDLAQRLGINGTPHFRVGDKTLAGAPGDLLAQLKSNIAEARKSGCRLC